MAAPGYHIASYWPSSYLQDDYWPGYAPIPGKGCVYRLVLLDLTLSKTSNISDNYFDEVHLDLTKALEAEMSTRLCEEVTLDMTPSLDSPIEVIFSRESSIALSLDIDAEILSCNEG